MSLTLILVLAIVGFLVAGYRPFGKAGSVGNVVTFMVMLLSTMTILVVLLFALEAIVRS